MARLIFISLAALFGIAFATSQHKEHRRYLRSTVNVTDCGRLPETFKGGNLPWNALVFKKLDTLNNQPNNRYLCAGTLVTPKVVISVADCFTSSDGTPWPASQHAVALGKNDRSWSSSDSGVQTSDVSSITIPPRYVGLATNYQNDISILRLTQAATFTPTVRPACLSFDRNLESQLTNGAKGKIVFPKDNQQNQLQTLEATYSPVADCLSKSPKEFAPFFTADKICATVNASPDLVGIGGSGLAFANVDKDTTRYFVVGLASTAPQTKAAPILIAFTRLIDHEQLLRMALYEGQEL